MTKVKPLMRRLAPFLLSTLYFLLTTLYFLLSTLYFLLTTSPVLAADYQQCAPSTTCTIGEFLYDDSYAALPGQTCTLTAKYPAGAAFLTAEPLTNRGDGWYSYNASIGTTEGLYSATICCTVSGNPMCLDKSFEVNSTAADVWGYSGRTLTSYGTLVADIWIYSTRSLTSLGTLAADVWGYSGRTLTSFGSLVTDIWGVDNRTLSSSTPAPSTLQNILAEQQEQRDLLEKLVNAPVVTLSLEDSDTPDLSAKLDASKTQTASLYDLIQSTKSRLLVLDEKWGRLGQEAITKELTSLANLFTDPAPVTALTKAWDDPVITALNRDTISAKDSLTTLLTSATITKSALPPSSMLAAIESLSQLETTLGDVTSDTQTSVFGYLATVSERHTLLESENQKLAMILEDWEGQGESVLGKRVRDSRDRLLALNRYPGGDRIVTPFKSGTDRRALKNQVFSLQGLVALNQNLLAGSANAPVRGLWLEEGSIIFRAVITNPSTLISQTAPLKFFLPRELKSEHVITLDPSLTTAYDPQEESLAVTGSYQLEPGDTKIVAVEVEDIWKLSSTELEGMRTQATDLLKSLEKTSYFTQGTTLKGSIESTLDKLQLSQNDNVKPENRIRAYRESRLELARAESDLTQLQNLVAQATGSTSLLGFVGGVGTTAVFGIILVVVTGFVFLSLYFKKLVPATVLSEPSQAPTSPSSTHQPSAIPRLTPLTLPPPRPNWQMPAVIAVVAVVTAGGTLLLTRVAEPKTEPAVNQIVPATPSPTPTAQPTPQPTPTPVLGDQSPGFTLEVPTDSSVNLRNAASATADILMAVKETQDVFVFGEDGDWRQIGFTPADEPKSYWVHSRFVTEK